MEGAMTAWVIIGIVGHVGLYAYVGALRYLHGWVCCLLVLPIAGMLGEQ